MTRDKALELLRGGPEGIQKWNEWVERGGNVGQVDLSAAKLEGASLRFAKLKGARLVAAELEGAHLKWAKLGEANLFEAKLKGADLSAAELGRAHLQGAELEGASLEGARLEGADLRGVRGLRLDNTFIRNAQFSPAGFDPRGSDPWTQLRQRYTGPRMIFNLLLLLMFLVPLATKVLFWSGVQESQVALGPAAAAARVEMAELRDELEGYSACAPALDTAERVEKFVSNPNLTKCLGKEKCNKRSVLMVLMGSGSEHWWIPFLSVLMLIYNILRAIMTWFVGGMRDNEERSGWSPPYDQKFKILVGLHYATWGFGVAAVTSFMIHAITFLSSTVYVPW